MKFINRILFQSWMCPDCGDEHTSFTATGWTIIVACAFAALYGWTRL